MKLSEFSSGHEGREVFWNAQSFEVLLFLFTGAAMAIFAYGVYRRWQMWAAMGKPEIRWDNLGERIKLLLRDGLLQIKTFKDIYPGIMHGLIFFGFLVLIFGAAFDATEFHVAEPLGIPFLTGKFYLFFSFLMDLFGLAVLIGVFMAIDRRYLSKPDRLGYKGAPDNTADDAIVLLLLAAIIITGFIIEALGSASPGSKPPGRSGPLWAGRWRKPSPESIPNRPKPCTSLPGGRTPSWPWGLSPTSPIQG